MKSEPTSSGCICMSYEVQVEDDIPFYDPENKSLRRTDGKKFRYYWCGCPQHNGRTFYRTPTEEEGRKIADRSAVRAST